MLLADSGAAVEEEEEEDSTWLCEVKLVGERILIPELVGEFLLPPPDIPDMPMEQCC